MTGNKKVFITGATGFIGQQMTAACIHAGYEVHVYIRHAHKRQLLESLGAHVWVGALTNIQVVTAALEGIHYVIHLAGVVKSARKNDFYQVNCEGTRAVMAAINSHRDYIQHVIVMSSLEAGGPTIGREKDEKDPDQPVTEYGKSKCQAEKIVRQYAGCFPITILRPPAVYGPGDKGMLPFFKAVKKGIQLNISHDSRTVSLISVHNLIRSCLICLSRSSNTVEMFYISDPQPIWQWNEIYQLLADQIHSRIWFVIRLPHVLWWAICHIGHVFQWLTGIQGWLNHTRYKTFLSTNWTCSNLKFRTTHPSVILRSTESEIKDTWTWYEHNKWV